MIMEIAYGPLVFSMIDQRQVCAARVRSALPGLPVPYSELPLSSDVTVVVGEMAPGNLLRVEILGNSPGPQEQVDTRSSFPANLYPRQQACCLR